MLLQSLQELNDAIKEVTQIVDSRMDQPASERTDRVGLAPHVLELAGAGNLVPAPLRTGSGRRYGEYTPNAIAGEQP